MVPVMIPDFRTRNDQRNERGVALAELTIVVPIMLMLLLVVFDFGRGFMEFVSVSNGARDGARVAAQYDIDCTNSSDRATIAAAARAAAAPLPSPSITVTHNATDGTCSVEVSHTYQMVIPFVSDGFTLPIIGTVGPLWDGTMSETMVSA